VIWSTGSRSLLEAELPSCSPARTGSRYDAGAGALLGRPYLNPGQPKTVVSGDDPLLYCRRLGSVEKSP
jgi:hypothetical protein